MRSLCCAFLICSLGTVSHAALASISMYGFVTQMPPIGQEVPAPWNTAVVGDPWSLTLTFEDSTVGIPAGTQTMFPGFARSYVMTLGSISVFGTLPAVPALSQAFVQNNATDYMGFDFLMTQGPVRFGAGLTDLDGTAFNSQSMLPTSFATHLFEIRDAGIWRANGGGPNVAMRFSVTSVIPGPGAVVVMLVCGVVAAGRRGRK